MRPPCQVRLLSVCSLLLLTVSSARAGLHYSGEEIAPLPSQWRGFLIDQRLLRNVSIKPRPGVQASPLRQHYEKAADELQKAARSRALTADESADLGALLIRLGEVPRAIEVLREAHRTHPRHYKIVSNLGTAWQLHGDLPQAEATLREAVKLAPGVFQRAEDYQLRLIRLRLRQPRNAQDLDNLLDIRFVGDKGEYEPGRLAADQKKKLPASAVADLQLLALWLPADARLLWLLGELAAVYGDLRTSAAIMDGCVTEFGLRAPELRQHRLLMREAANQQAKMPPGSKTQHEGHAGVLKTRSTRPLVDRQSLANLPPVKPDGLNNLPWNVVTRTTVDRQYRPTFPAYLRELDGKEVVLSGYMQPIGGDLDMGTFLLIEFPVGCWYCEMPDITAMVLVEMPKGKSHTFTREAIRVTGKLKLNANDLEDFLYKITAARVSAE
jgi:Tfp pilus assembly protein PilF